MKLRKSRYALDSLVVIGKAPLCPTCRIYMVPVNEEEHALPKLCRCPTCGAEAPFQWTH
jgi:hypothetical protein